MKKISLYVALCFLLILSLVSCTDTPVISEKVMLDINCEWEEPPVPLDNHDAILKITDSLDDYSETYTFEGIISPDTGEDLPSFNGYDIQIVRNDINYFPSQRGTIPFISEEMDHLYVWESLNNLSFSDEYSTRNELDGRVIIYFYKDGTQISEFYICPDGIVLKSVEKKDGSLAYYESITPVDYYHISALEVKYGIRTDKIYWKFHEPQTPENYKLCISSPSGKKVFSLDEAEETLASLLNTNEIENLQITTTVNHSTPHSPDSYIKITEYYTPYIDDPTTIEEQTFYLCPNGKLMADIRSAFAHIYHSQHLEQFECNYWWQSVEQFDYDAFVDMLAK